MERDGAVALGRRCLWRLANSHRYTVVYTLHTDARDLAMLGGAISGHNHGKTQPKNEADSPHDTHGQERGTTSTRTLRPRCFFMAAEVAMRVVLLTNTARIVSEKLGHAQEDILPLLRLSRLNIPHHVGQLRKGQRRVWVVKHIRF